jgi:nucleoside-diphosphate-sugar epimerase
MTTLVTGGAGFIGSHLTESLLGSGEDVIVLDDLSTGSEQNLGGGLSHPPPSARQGLDPRPVPGGRACRQGAHHLPPRRRARHLHDPRRGVALLQ